MVRTASFANATGPPLLQLSRRPPVTTVAPKCKRSGALAGQMKAVAIKVAATANVHARIGGFASRLQPEAGGEGSVASGTLWRRKEGMARRLSASPAVAEASPRNRTFT